MSRLIEYVLAAIKPLCNAERLPLRPHSRCMRGEVACGRNHEVTRYGRVAGRNRYWEGRLHTLDAMEIAILAQQHPSQSGLQGCRIGIRAKVLSQPRGYRIHLLLHVEQHRQLAQHITCAMPVAANLENLCTLGNLGS